MAPTQITVGTVFTTVKLLGHLFKCSYFTGLEDIMLLLLLFQMCKLLMSGAIMHPHTISKAGF